MSILTFFLLIIIGLLAGLLSGVIGVGGGLIMIPLLLLLGLSQHEAQGTSLAVMLPPIGVLAVMNYYNAGFVKWDFAIIIAVTFIVGGYFGSKYAISLNPGLLKKLFGFIMLVVAIKFIIGK